jgi:hypothetical protein
MIGKKGARHKGLVLRSGTRGSAALQRVFEVAHFLREKPLSRGGSDVQLFWNGYTMDLDTSPGLHTIRLESNRVYAAEWAICASHALF